MKYKKTGAFLLAFTMLFCTACGSSPNNNPASGSPPSSVQDSGIESKENTITFGDYRGNKWEYTAQKAIVYDHYNESGLPEDAFFEGVNDQKLVIVEVTIKKSRGPNDKTMKNMILWNISTWSIRTCGKLRKEKERLLCYPIWSISADMRREPEHINTGWIPAKRPFFNWGGVYPTENMTAGQPIWCF